MVVKLSSLRRLWRSLLDLRRTSNMNLINAFVMLEVYLLKKQQKKCVSLTWCMGLFIFTNFVESRANLWNCHCHPISLSRFIRGWFLA